MGQSGKRQSGKQDNPTNTKENPADSKHVCQIVTAVTYSLSDCLWCLSDFLSSMFVGLSSLPDFFAWKSGKLTEITHAIRQTLLISRGCCPIVICDHYPYIAILYQYFSTINHNYSPLTTSCNNYHVTVMHLVFWWNIVNWMK